MDEEVVARQAKSKASPLSYSYPSPMMLVHYPLFATNVKMLCQTDGWKAPAGGNSLMATINALRLTYNTEGLQGLYRGGHLYLLHQVCRESFRFCAVHTWAVVERRLRRRLQRQWRKSSSTRGDSESSARGDEDFFRRCLYWSRMATKYSIDFLSYPVLLASTRVVILPALPMGTWGRVCLWSSREGVSSLFNGVTCSLVSTALDEAMEIGLETLINRATQSTELEPADKLLLKASAMSVVSVFTAPFNYVGVIQRCQSSLPGLLSFSPVSTLVQKLPWRGSFFQFFLFGGIFALNYQLVKLKAQVQEDNDYDDRRLQPRVE